MAECVVIESVMRSEKRVAMQALTVPRIHDPGQREPSRKVSLHSYPCEHQLCAITFSKFGPRPPWLLISTLSLPYIVHLSNLAVLNEANSRHDWALQNGAGGVGVTGAIAGLTHGNDRRWVQEVARPHEVPRAITSAALPSPTVPAGF